MFRQCRLTVYKLENIWIVGTLAPQTFLRLFLPDTDDGFAVADFYLRILPPRRGTDIAVRENIVVIHVG